VVTDKKFQVTKNKPNPGLQVKNCLQITRHKNLQHKVGISTPKAWSQVNAVIIKFKSIQSQVSLTNQGLLLN